MPVQKQPMFPKKQEGGWLHETKCQKWVIVKVVSAALITTNTLQSFFLSPPQFTNPSFFFLILCTQTLCNTSFIKEYKASGYTVYLLVNYIYRFYIGNWRINNFHLPQSSFLAPIVSFNKGLCLVGTISWSDKHNTSLMYYHFVFLYPSYSKNLKVNNYQM